MQVHLIDGTYELFRMFFGAPAATAPDGREVGATRALLRSLLALLRQPGVTHVAIAFDHVIESFRNRLYAGYKTGEGIEPALRAQFELAEEACRALGLVVWSMVEFEADDALASGAARFAAAPGVEQVLLCSPDKDLAQCVSGRAIVQWDRRQDLRCDEDGVRAKFGVAPASIPDYLALVGDSADGIPGLPGWGAKSSGQILAVYDHLETIPRDVELWSVRPRGAAKLAEVLFARWLEAELYRELATLRRDVPLSEPLEALAWRGAPRDELEALCERLGERDLLPRVPLFRAGP